MEQMGMDEEAAIKYLNVSTMFIFVKCVTQKYEMTLFIFKENERPHNLYKLPSPMVHATPDDFENRFSFDGLAYCLHLSR